MRIKAEMAFDLLEAELEVMDRNARSEILGGEYEWWIVNDQVYYREGGQDTWNYWQNLHDAVIHGSGYNSGYGSSGDGFNNNYSSCGYPDAPGASGSFYTWYDEHYRGNGNDGISHQVEKFKDVQDAASLAVSNGTAWKEFYGVLGTINTNTVVNMKTVLEAVFDANPLGSVIDELRPENLKGIGILSAAGKVLGVTGAVTSVATLYYDYQDDGHIETINLVDAGMSCGALFIKSNIAGFVISGGWLLIKGEFFEDK